MGAKLFLILLTTMLFSATSFGTPPFLSHQGYILDSNNQPLSGVNSVTLSLYNAANGGSPLWTETIDIAFDSGFYSLSLGTDQPLETALFEGDSLYLGVTVESNGEFAPRQKVVSVPYAMKAAMVEDSALDSYLTTHNYVTTDDTVAGLDCEAGEIAKWSGSAWECAEDGGGSGGILQVGTDSGDCDEAGTGTLRWNTATEVLEICNGTRWAYVSEENPTVSAIEPTEGSELGGFTAVITGQDFQPDCVVEFGSESSPDVQFDSITQLTVTLPVLSPDTYDIKITNPSGRFGVLEASWTSREDNPPVWQTEGDLGNVSDTRTGTHFTLEATDADGDTVTYALLSGNLPAGLSFDTNSGEISGDPDDVYATSNFTIRATSSFSGIEQNADREFSITIIEGGDGTSADTAGFSCKSINDDGFSTGDGFYWIAPPGFENSPFEVYCDQTLVGGGWTVMVGTYYADHNNGVAHNCGASACGDIREATTGSTGSPGGRFKLSDDQIRAVISLSDNAHNADYLWNQIGHNNSHSSGNLEYVTITDYTGEWHFDRTMGNSQTTATLTSYIRSNNAINWQGNLPNNCTSGIAGINCHTLSGQIPTICNQNLGSGWTGTFHFYMAEHNDDNYLYFCNAAQHTSTNRYKARYFVRERN